MRRVSDAEANAIGRYRLEAPLGRGGAGIVYRAHDTRLQRMVALKVLSDAPGGPRGRQLLNEARAAAQLNHPHICTVYEVSDDGMDGGPAYIAMEYLDGEPLSASIAARRLPPAQATAVATQILDALDHAHGRGVIHGDLKSSNVMVLTDGRIKLVDFGLARRTQVDLADNTASATTTHSIEIAGTLPYMAPELFRGAPSDARSDLWAFGVLLFEMSAGRRPFDGQTSWELAAHIIDRPPPPLPDTVSRTTRAVIGRCLEKDPARRFAVARDAARELRGEGESSELTRSGSSQRHRPRRRTPRIRSIAVLPLDDRSSAAGSEHIAEGMTDALIATLSKLEPLRVPSRMTMSRYKVLGKSLPEIAAELDIDAVIEGSVMREDSRLRLTARLLHAPSDTQLWSETYDRDAHDILSIETELARAIVDGVQLRLNARDTAILSAKPRVDASAYESYLRGRYHWNRRSGEDLRKAAGAFREAIARAPSYAQPYVGMADCHLTSVSYGLVAPHAAMPAMKEMVIKALALDSGLAEAHLACGMVNFFYDWDWVAAERSLTRALKLDDRSATAHVWYGLFLATMRRPLESVGELAAAVNLEPLSPTILAVAASGHYLNGAYEKAEELCRAALELDPDSILGHLHLVLPLEATGRYEEGRQHAQSVVENSRGYQVGRTVLARLEVKCGNVEKARATLRELSEMSASRYISAPHVAVVHAAMGELDVAFQWLERAVDDRALHMVTLDVDPIFDPLRVDSRFAALRQRLGFP